MRLVDSMNRYNYGEGRGRGRGREVAYFGVSAKNSEEKL